VADIEFPSELVDLQRAADRAWAQLEAHRKQVDARRRQDTPDTPGRPGWVARPLRPWTEDEDEEHARLMGAAATAQEAVRAGIADAGLTPDVHTVQKLKQAAKAQQQ
jgi:hypothetical protein